MVQGVSSFSCRGSFANGGHWWTFFESIKHVCLCVYTLDHQSSFVEPIILFPLDQFADTSDRPTLQRSGHGMDVSFDDNNSTHGYSSDLSNEESGHTR